MSVKISNLNILGTDFQKFECLHFFRNNTDQKYIVKKEKNKSMVFGIGYLERKKNSIISIKNSDMTINDMKFIWFDNFNDFVRQIYNGIIDVNYLYNSIHLETESVFKPYKEKIIDIVNSNSNNMFVISPENIFFRLPKSISATLYTNEMTQYPYNTPDVTTFRLEGPSSHKINFTINIYYEYGEWRNISNNVKIFKKNLEDTIDIKYFISGFEDAKKLIENSEEIIVKKFSDMKSESFETFIARCKFNTNLTIKYDKVSCFKCVKENDSYFLSKSLEFENV